MTQVIVSGVTKRFGDTQVLRGVDLVVSSGELTAILGPSGCGKTTLLRLIVGFDVPDSGTIQIGDTVVSEGHRAVPPERRGVGYVAQEGALFPHLTVAANITFGLPRRSRRRSQRVGELLDLVGLEASYATRYPHELSGGQQQRVALARALAPGPSVVLLDEPFSALDAGLRADTRRAVVDALTASGVTAVLVTHDQAEALSVARQVTIMRSGRLVQVASPTDLYHSPADVGVAGFVGEAVVLPATVSCGVAECSLGQVRVRAVDGCPVDGACCVMVRPEQIVLGDRRGDLIGDRVGEWPHGGGGASARVEGLTFYGHDATVTLRLIGSDVRVMARCSGHDLPAPGDEVLLTVSGEGIAYPAPATVPAS